MAEYPNVSEVRSQARKTWEKEARKQISIQERVGQSVPSWLILIAAVFFALSFPHTAAIFDKLTPGWGWIAPAGVEFGLLFSAFRRKQVQSWQLRALEILLFITAIVVNGAGSFISVVDASGLAKLSLSELQAQFGALPASNQVALVLVPFAAFIIPIGTSVAGEGLAALILEHQKQGSLLDMRWRHVAYDVEFTALRDAAINAGIPPTRAAEWASKIVGQQLNPQDMANTAKPVDPRPESAKDSAGQNGTEGQRTVRDNSKLGQALRLIDEHPEYMSGDYSLRDLAEETGINKNIWAEARKRFSSNGHGEG